MTPEMIVAAASQFALVALSLALLVTAFRVVVGPTLPDRVVALDMLVAIAIGFIAVFAIWTGYTFYIDIALALGLAGFLATIAFARYIISHGPDKAQKPRAKPEANRNAPGKPAKNRRQR
jgi:multicomponent Na+:H+ antiporter subunit F